MSPLTLGLDALAFGGEGFFDLPLVSFMVRLFPLHTYDLAARRRSWQSSSDRHRLGGDPCNATIGSFARPPLKRWVFVRTLAISEREI